MTVTGPWSPASAPASERSSAIPSSDSCVPDLRQATWLSQGLASLVRSMPARRATRHGQGRSADFDVVIVGSGYGGALAARELAGRQDASGQPLSVCVLERGGEYLPGMFPSRLSELPGHVRFATGGSAPGGQRDGLFDLRLGGDVNALVASGLGGGSLINAGVMARPHPTVLADPGWPTALRQAGLDTYFDQAEHLLGARAVDDDSRPNTIACQGATAMPAKFSALQRLDPGRCRPAPITVSMVGHRNRAGVDLAGCNRCGDCATGCNHQAKQSLDTNALVQARRQGAEIFTGATVLRIERAASGPFWTLLLVPTAVHDRRRDPVPVRVTAGKVVLAAGSFGSTEILMRSARDDLAFSQRLGQGFSSNGDMIAVVYDQHERVDGAVDETVAPALRNVGPTITGIVDLRDAPGPDGQPIGLVIEDLAIPGGLRRMFEESTTTSITFERLKQSDDATHRADDVGLDPAAVDPAAISRSLPVAVIGRDSASGQFELTDPTDDSSDGALVVRWPRLRDEPLFKHQIDVVAQCVKASGAGGTVVPNPVWRLLPPELDFLFGGQLGPPLTVHPLGGCPMGDDVRHGVVDHLGRVFDPRGGEGAVHDGLVVLDGAVIPVSLGINPALTIAAVALRAVAALCDRVWQLAPVAAPASPAGPGQASGPAPALGPRPVYAVPPTVAHVPTVVRVLERLTGPVPLAGRLGDVDCVVELTLPFRAIDLHALMQPLQRTLTVRVGDAGQPGANPVGRLRVYRRQDWLAIEQPAPMHGRPRGADIEAALDAAALLIAPLSGQMTLLTREPSTRGRRAWRALFAWARNRGVRDTWQWFRDKRRDHAPGSGIAGALADGRALLGSAFNLATRAGEVRLFEYQLQIGAPLKDHSAPLLGKTALADAISASPAIRGVKRITYDLLCNPWEQLSSLQVEQFPLMAWSARPPLLKLDVRFLARKRVPLFEVVSRQDEVMLIVDLVSFGLQMLRMLVNVHAWSFRRPDSPVPREPQRLPGPIPGRWPLQTLHPRIVEIQVDRLDGGEPVLVRLTRYARQDSALPPVLMFHGYSASGTTFAHPAIEPNLAGWLHGRGRDVWVVDLRTSAGMPTARLPWRYEDPALIDIPAAIDHVVREVSRERGGVEPQVDLVAHCMGAAMLSMALLSAPRSGERYFRERELLPARVRRVVLSQIGPLMVFSPANVFRAYAMRWVRQLLPLSGYEFRPRVDAGLADQMVDRLLATVPYPRSERRRANPLRFWRNVAWAGSRSRMDALYGRAFSLSNLGDRALAHIDDLFGPLSIDTVAQTIYFAQRQMVTDFRGRNTFVSRDTLRDRWGAIPTMSLHGLDNGLADPATLARMASIAGRDAGLDLQVCGLPGFGHQDSLIGKEAGVVFRRIERFLALDRPARAPTRADRPSAGPSAGPAPGRRLLVQAPWIGPIRGPLITGADGRRTVTLSAAANPALGGARKAVLVSMPAGARIKVYPQPADTDGWLTVQLALDEWDPATREWMLLLAYDQPAELDHASAPLDDSVLIDETHDQARDQERAPVHSIPADRFQDALARMLGRGAPGGFEQARITLAQPPADAPVVRFAFASCQYPAGMLVERIAYESYRRLAGRLDGPQAPSAVLLLGDQVYTDATAGLFDPGDGDAHDAKPYERLLRIAPVRRLLRQVPVYMMLDDHELIDNWEPAVSGGGDDLSLQAGRRNYRKYQRSAGPPLAAPVADAPAPLWYSLQIDGVEAFMMDTRTERQPRSAAGIESAALFSQAQFDAVCRWLERLHQADRQRPGVPAAAKFICSPAMLLPRHLFCGRPDDPAGALASDSWDGYPASLHSLLAFICELGVANLVFLSGDEHIACVTSASVQRDEPGALPVRIRSFHSPALFAPYPFANGNAQQFRHREAWSFEASVAGAAPARYRCDVQASFPGVQNGFGLIDVVRDTGQVQLRYSFADGSFWPADQVTGQT